MATKGEIVKATDFDNYPTNTTLTNKLASYTTTANMPSYLLTKIYPVGSIYISTNSISPASFLGGSWTQITGQFLLAAGGGIVLAPPAVRPQSL